MAKNEKTSKKVASVASKGLRNPGSLRPIDWPNSPKIPPWSARRKTGMPMVGSSLSAGLTVWTYPTCWQPRDWPEHSFYSDAYVEPEGKARAAGLGVWQADTETPWGFRANRWQRAADAAPRKGCPIKGNLNLKGEKIYHIPWSPWYAKTKISEADGEQWFCDEAEAVAAGWRATRSR